MLFSSFINSLMFSLLNSFFEKKRRNILCIETAALLLLLRRAPWRCACHFRAIPPSFQCRAFDRLLVASLSFLEASSCPFTLIDWSHFCLHLACLLVFLLPIFRSFFFSQQTPSNLKNLANICTQIQNLVIQPVSFNPYKRRYKFFTTFPFLFRKSFHRLFFVCLGKKPSNTGNNTREYFFVCWFESSFFPWFFSAGISNKNVIQEHVISWPFTFFHADNVYRRICCFVNTMIAFSLFD